MNNLKNIFLADADDVMFFADALREIAPGCTLTVAGNGRELLEKLAVIKAIPELIFLDGNMPLMGGLETLKAIRQSETLHAVPVAIYSTSRSQSEVTAAYEQGANYYISKPHCFATLKNMLRELLDATARQSANAGVPAQ